MILRGTAALSQGIRARYAESDIRTPLPPPPPQTASAAQDDAPSKDTPQDADPPPNTAPADTDDDFDLSAGEDAGKSLVPYVNYPSWSGVLVPDSASLPPLPLSLDELENFAPDDTGDYSEKVGVDAGNVSDKEDTTSAPHVTDRRRVGIAALLDASLALSSAPPLEELQNTKSDVCDSSTADGMDEPSRHSPGSFSSDVPLADASQPLFPSRLDYAFALTSLARSVLPSPSPPPSESPPPSRGWKDLPHNVFHAIFSNFNLARVPQPSRSGVFPLFDLRPDFDVAKLNAASVCRSWRTAALGMKDLWSVVALRGIHHGPGQRHVDQVKSLIERSKSSGSPSPLYICIRWDNVDQWSVEAHRYSAEIFKEISGSSRRWKYVELVIGCGVPDGLACIWTSPAPRLQGFVLSILGHREPPAPQGSLAFGTISSTLGNRSYLSSPRSWATLTAVAKNLQVLQLRATDTPGSWDVAKEVKLPCLHTLLFDADEPNDAGEGNYAAQKGWLNMLKIDCLLRLGLSSHLLGGKVQPFLRKVAPSVVSLALWGRVSGVEIVHVMGLENVETLELGRADGPDRCAETVGPGTFDTVRHLHLFPKLTELRVFARKGEINASSTGLLRLHRDRSYLNIELCEA